MRRERGFYYSRRLTHSTDQQYNVYFIFVFIIRFGVLNVRLYMCVTSKSMRPANEICTYNNYSNNNNIILIISTSKNSSFFVFRLLRCAHCAVCVWKSHVFIYIWRLNRYLPNSEAISQFNFLSLSLLLTRSLACSLPSSIYFVSNA